MGITSSTSGRGLREVPPAWVNALVIPPECAMDKIGGMSDGMCCVTTPNTAIRSRAGHFDSDGIRWSRGFTSGKHSFEIYFTDAHRGVEASVGVGTESAPLYAKGKVPLVGSNSQSWGISLRTKRAFHKNVMVKKYPSTQQRLPDKFYMYLDADTGSLQFGSDIQFYGTAHGNLPRNQPLYPMLSCTNHGANITIIYRGMGSAAPSLLPQGVMYSQQVQPGPFPPQQSTVVVAPGASMTVINSANAHPSADAQGYNPGPSSFPPPPAYEPAPAEVEKSPAHFPEVPAKE